jgi:hypothetical protein
MQSATQPHRIDTVAGRPLKRDVVPAGQNASRKRAAALSNVMFPGPSLLRVRVVAGSA